MMMKLLFLCFVGLSVAVVECNAYATTPPPSSSGKKVWNMYTPGGASSSNMDSSSPSHDQRSSTGTGWQLSQTTDSFETTMTSTRRTVSSSGGPRMSHGILSPEIVSRMDELTCGGADNDAVRNFLRTYRRTGPMSCLEMLSDPEILPHLTNAMRDIV